VYRFQDPDCSHRVCTCVGCVCVLHVAFEICLDAVCVCVVYVYVCVPRYAIHVSVVVRVVVAINRRPIRKERIVHVLSPPLVFRKKLQCHPRVFPSAWRIHTLCVDKIKKARTRPK
jgi:hypothetical protein